MNVGGKTTKKKPSKIEEMTKDQIRQAILKKRECNTRAQYIVESLLEKGISPEYMLKCLPEINQSHFDDVIEERSILYLCGYPICQNTLSKEDIPKQKYRISVKTNKVYDITERKNFCSNSCYKSAMYLKKQMLISPLWFREYEEIPIFQLLPTESVGCIGLEVDVSLIDRVKIDSQKKSFMSVNEFTSASFDEITHKNYEKLNESKEDIIDDHESNKSLKKDMISDYLNREIENKNKIEDKTLHTQVSNKNQVNIIDKATNDALFQAEPLTLEPEQTPESDKTKANKKVKNSLNIVGKIIEKPEKKLDPIVASESNTVKEEKLPNKEKNIKRLTKKQPILCAITIEVENCLAEWFTLDTLLFLFGEVKVREMVTGKGRVIKEYIDNHTQSIFYKSNAYDQYQALYRKLNLLELEDRQLNAQTLQRETKPLPDYKILKEESKKIELKVKAFVTGELEIPESEQEEIYNTEDSENITYLPLVDSKAQNALRRKIVCHHLNKVLPDLKRSLNIENVSIASEVRLLVKTFILKPNNIMFKPIQWTLIAIIFINLLSLRDERLAFILKQPKSDQHMQLLLLSYKQDGCYIQRLISWLTNIDRLLDTHNMEMPM